MNEISKNNEIGVETEGAESPLQNTTDRRRFLGHLTKTAAAAAVAGTVGIQPFLGGKSSAAEASVVPYNSGSRADRSFRYRRNVALAERIDVGVQPDNGDAARYSDFSGSYSKALLHSSLGIPSAGAFNSLRNALSNGNFAGFENILVGTPGGGGNARLNGPQVALAFDLEGLDAFATVIPPSPTTRSAQTAAEQVEHYWGALLADVPFSRYSTNAQVARAVADMNSMSYLQSPANDQFPFPVTAQNLFRGRFVSGDGNVRGPYVSQFMVQPTFFGVQPLSQQYQTFLPGSSFLTSVGDYQLVQNGGDTGQSIPVDSRFRYVRNGRDLTAYTRVDVLYQAYFTAFLILAGIGAAPNPGNPYIGSQTQKAFATLGGPDVAGTLAEMATRALKGAWYHKWIKDLRQRPEEYGALIHARMTNTNPQPQASAELHPDVLNSDGLARTFSNTGTYLLPLAFPEGSPTHPCYPTGHGTVGGACITALKFFFNGSQLLRPLLQAAGTDVVEPSPNGLSLNPYTGSDRNSIDINGELNKLAYNVTFGHGIHAGIHFRSSSYWSILLGEQIGLSVLQDRAASYNEPFSIDITKFDGTTATISNL
ncbi:MAG: vanadium-dependent haloperoxidase [Pyrinomonadaceae bacterium]